MLAVFIDKYGSKSWRKASSSSLSDVIANADGC